MKVTLELLERLEACPDDSWEYESLLARNGITEEVTPENIKIALTCDLNLDWLLEVLSEAEEVSPKLRQEYLLALRDFRLLIPEGECYCFHCVWKYSHHQNAKDALVELIHKFLPKLLEEYQSG